MNYTVEELGPLKKKIAAAVPAAEVDALLRHTAERYRAAVNIPGFRKGKAPLGMVEKQFARDILSETSQELTDKLLKDILTELGLEPAARPVFDAPLPARGQDFACSFTLETLPVFALPDYAGFPLEQEEAGVEESDVDSVLDRMRKDATEFILVEEQRPPRDGEAVELDYVLLDSEGKEQPELKAEKARIVLNDNITLAGFADVVQGLRPGQEGQGKVVMPENNFKPDSAGKEFNIKVRLHGVFTCKLPDLDDAFAVKAGLPTLRELREEVRAGFLRVRAQAAEGAARRALLDSLLARTDYPLPESLVESQKTMLVMEALQRLLRGGGLKEDPAASVNKLKEEAGIEAERSVRAYIFLRAVAEAEGVKVGEEDVLRHIQGLAAAAGHTFEDELKAYRNDERRLNAAYADVLMDKALDALYAKAQVSLVPAGAAGEKAGAAAGDSGTKDAEKDVSDESAPQARDFAAKEA